MRGCSIHLNTCFIRLLGIFLLDGLPRLLPHRFTKTAVHLQQTLQWHQLKPCLLSPVQSTEFLKPFCFPWQSDSHKNFMKFFSRIIWLSLRLHMIKKRCCTFITNGQCNMTALIFTEAFVLQQICRSFNNLARQQSITGISTREGKHGMNASSLGNRTKPFKHSFRWLGNYQMVSPRLQFSHPIAWVLPGLSGQSAFTPMSCF